MKARIITVVLLLFVLESCVMYKEHSDFTPDKVSLGMNKETFIEKFGKPYKQNFFYNDEHVYCEKLFYKEDVLIGKPLKVSITKLLSIFLFEDGILVSQTQREPDDYKAVEVYERVEKYNQDKENND